VTTHLTIEDRCRGALLGLTAGDRNGGPNEMAARLTEGLAEQGRFDRDDVLARYVAWWRDGACAPAASGTIYPKKQAYSSLSTTAKNSSMEATSGAGS